MGQQHLSTVPEKETNQRIDADLPPKALARRLVDAAIAEAEAEEDDDDLGLYIHCDIGTMGNLNVVVTHNELDGAQVKIWDSEESWRSHPNFCLDPDELPKLIQALLTAKFASKMLSKRG